MDVTLNICRYNPQTDQQHYFQEFTVAVEPYQTVLDAMLKAWEQDPGLSFRRSCRSAICGSCACTINGRPSLACQTLISSAVGEDRRILLEPLPHFRQLKDLVVDLEPFFNSLKAVVPWLLTKDQHDGLMDPELARKMESTATCILCGVCDGAAELSCDIKPAALVKGLKHSMDPRDALGSARLQLMNVPPEVIKLFMKNLPEQCPKKITITE